MLFSYSIIVPHESRSKERLSPPLLQCHTPPPCRHGGPLQVDGESLNASGDVKPPNYGDLLDLPNNSYELTDLTNKNGEPDNNYDLTDLTNKNGD